MFKSLLVTLLLNLFSLSLSAQDVSSFQELLNQLSNASQTQGLQIGIEVDPHASSTTKPHFTVVTINNAQNNTAYHALERSNITVVYHPQYDEFPNLMIISMMGYGRDKTSTGARQWAFFTYNKSTNKWVVSDKGVGEKRLSDGDIIGFSRTAWDASYNPIDNPRKE